MDKQIKHEEKKKRRIKKINNPTNYCRTIRRIVKTKLISEQLLILKGSTIKIIFLIVLQR